MFFGSTFTPSFRLVIWHRFSMFAQSNTVFQFDLGKTGHLAQGTCAHKRETERLKEQGHQ